MLQPQREPRQPRTDQGVTVLGIDPGWAKMGAAVLLQPEGSGPIVPVAVNYLKTKPESKKQKNLRVSADDTRRLREIWDWVNELMLEHRPQAVGVEVYSPGKPPRVGAVQGPANLAWKTSMGYAAAQMAAWSHGVALFVFLPQDVKRAFHLQQSTSKDDVAQTLCRRFPVLPGLIAGRAKEQHEHLYDAVGLAYLALEELYALRAVLGVRS